MPSDETVDFAWACGLFEGEGCIQLRKSGGALDLTSTDYDVISRFKRIVGCGSISERGGWNKPIYVWKLTLFSDVESLLIRMSPFLGERRKAKAQEVLFNRPKHGPYGANNGEKTHCPHGHEYALTAYHRPSGGRVCVECYPNYRASRERQIARTE